MWKSLRLAAPVLAAILATGPATAEESITLKFSNLWPENHYLWTQGAKVFADAATEATNKQIQFQGFHASQLGKDQLKLLSSGIADIATVAAPYAADKLPLTGVSELPGFSKTSCDSVNRLWPMAQEGGVLDKAEYQALGLHVLFVAVPPAYKLMTSNKTVASLEDLSGLKLRVVGGAQSDTVRALGGVPVQVQAGEFYDTVSRGTVDGAIYIWVGVPPFSLQEVLHNSTEGFYAGSAAVLYGISQKKWDSFSDDTKKVLTEAAAKAQKNLCEYQDREENGVRDKYVAENGLKITQLTPEESARWAEKLAPVADAWAKKLDANGRPGTEVLRAYAGNSN